MKVPNADRAIIAAATLTGYLLNVSHKRGGPKARLLSDLRSRLSSLSQLAKTPLTSGFPVEHAGFLNATPSIATYFN